MTRSVVWSRTALDELKAQVAYIAADNPVAARRVAAAIKDTASALAAIPTGRPGRVARTYEKSVPRLPYIIAYAIAASTTCETIAIVRVIHTARDWPSGEWPES